MKIRFERAAGDPHLYTASKEMFPIAVYVDDIFFTGRSNERLTAVKLDLLEKFSSKRVEKVALLSGSEGHRRLQEWKYLNWTGVIHREYIKKIWYGRC